MPTATDVRNAARHADRAVAGDARLFPQADDGRRLHAGSRSRSRASTCSPTRFRAARCPRSASARRLTACCRSPRCSRYQPPTMRLRAARSSRRWWISCSALWPTWLAAARRRAAHAERYRRSGQGAGRRARHGRQLHDLPRPPGARRRFPVELHELSCGIRLATINPWWSQHLARGRQLLDAFGFHAMGSARDPSRAGQTTASRSRFRPCKPGRCPKPIR